MLAWSISWVLLAAPEPQVVDKEALLGPRKVQSAAAAYYVSPSRLGGAFEKPAGKGDDVIVVDVDGRWAKVTIQSGLYKGKTAYIDPKILVVKEKYDPGPSSAAEMKNINTDAYEGSRFDPATEAEYRKEKGKAIDDAYLALDELMKRPTYKTHRKDLEDELRAFRQVGKLGEYAAK
jgi:hypothetical protein